MIAGAEQTLVEREHQVRRLDEALARAIEGRGSVVAVEGAPGVGKTRLLQVAAGHATAAGVRVLRARGGDLERAMAFGVARQLLEPVLARADEHESAVLLRSAASLARGPLGYMLAGPAAEPHAARYGLFWLCANLAETGPLALVVDDAHWCDDESAEWLAYLAHRIDDLPVLVVLAHRPDETRTALRALVADRVAEAVSVDALGATAVEQIVEGAFPAASAPFREACRHACGGNPLLLWEMLEALEEARLDGSDEDVGRIEALGAANVASYVRSRLERLGPDALRLARAAAVLGEDIPSSLVADLAELSPVAAGRAADDLRTAHVLRPDDALGFVHPLVRAAVLDEMLPGARGELHAAAARGLAAADADGARVAAHLLQTPARGDGWAVERLRDAAARAVSAGAPEAAARLLDRALAEPPDPSDRVDVIVAAGSAASASDPKAAAAHFAAALALADTPARRASIVRPLAKALSHADRPREAVAALDEVLAELDGGDRETIRLVEAERLLWRAFWFDNTERRGDLTRLELLARGLGRTTAGERSIHALLGWHRVLDGAPAASARLEAESASSPGNVLTDPEMGFEFPITTASTLLFCGAAEEALRRFDRGIEELREAGRLVEVTFTFAHRAHARLRLGDLREAEADARTSWQLAEQLGPQAAAWWYALGMVVETLLARGAVEEAQAIVLATGTGDVTPDAVIFPMPRLVRGHLHAALGDHPRAVEDLLLVGTQLEDRGIRNPAWCPWRTSVAPSLAAVGRHDEARELVTEAVARARHVGSPSALGVGLRVAGELEGDEDAIAESVDVLRSSSARRDLAESLVAHGAALRRRGRRAAGREALREGLALAERCAADALAARAREEVTAAGGRLSKRPTSGLESLTASEMRVVRRAVDGLSNAEIAQDLFVTRKTIEKHLASAYRKLGCTRDGLAERLAA